MTSTEPVQNPPGKSFHDHSTSRKFVARYTSLDHVREFVGLSAQFCDFNAKEIYAVELATDEAFTNIVEHAYGGESDELVEVICTITASNLAVILHDCGRAFDPTQVPEPNLNAPLEDRETGGLGIFFMRKLMDEVYFHSATEDSAGCNTLIMIKHREKSE